MVKNTKCGYVAIIGRPNVGKSTLLNCILNKKISITTPKPQTTRTHILGIKTDELIQSIYIDTPGIHFNEKKAMNRYMNKLAGAVIKDADVILLLINSRWEDEDVKILDKLKHSKIPVILLINKVDQFKNKAELLPLIQLSHEKFDFKKIIPISAKNGENVADVIHETTLYFPEGPHLFEKDQDTDKNLQHQISELIREKIILETQKEIPYSTLVQIDEMSQDEKLLKISAIIWVEKESQKPIVIGKNGTLLKKIGTRARMDIEKLVGKKVFLQLWVKIKDDWTNNEKFLNTLGY